MLASFELGGDNEPAATDPELVAAG
jgi:hypothetical protein